MIKFRIQEFWHKHSIGVWIMDQRLDRTAVAEPVPLVFKDYGDGAFVLPDPTFELERKDMNQFLQALCEELARFGFKPNTERLEGELGATKKALDREQSSHDRIFNLLQDTVRLSLSPPWPKERVREASP